MSKLSEQRQRKPEIRRVATWLIALVFLEDLSCDRILSANLDFLKYAKSTFFSLNCLRQQPSLHALQDLSNCDKSNFQMDYEYYN